MARIFTNNIKIQNLKFLDPTPKRTCNLTIVLFDLPSKKGIPSNGRGDTKVVEYWRWQVLKHLSGGVNISRRRGAEAATLISVHGSMHGSVPTSYEPEVKSERVLETRNRAMHT